MARQLVVYRQRVACQMRVKEHETWLEQSEDPTLV
jgi:hypothetical protein